MLKLRIVGAKASMLHLSISQADEEWYRDVLYRLLERITLAHEELESGFTDNRYLRMAWASRSLLELRVWSLWIAKARDNAKRLRDDRLVDGNDIVDQFIKILQPLNVPRTDALKQELHVLAETIENAQEEAGLGDARWLPVKRHAKELGLVDVDPMYNFFSKLVHVTGMSLFAGVRPEQDAVWREVLYRCGGWYSDESLDALDGKLREIANK